MIVFKEKLISSTKNYDTFSKSRQNDPLFK